MIKAICSKIWGVVWPRKFTFLIGVGVGICVAGAAFYYINFYTLANFKNKVDMFRKGDGIAWDAPSIEEYKLQSKQLRDCQKEKDDLFQKKANLQTNLDSLKHEFSIRTERYAQCETENQELHKSNKMLLASLEKSKKTEERVKKLKREIELAMKEATQANKELALCKKQLSQKDHKRNILLNEGRFIYKNESKVFLDGAISVGVLNIHSAEGEYRAFLNFNGPKNYKVWVDAGDIVIFKNKTGYYKFYVMEIDSSSAKLSLYQITSGEVQYCK